MFLPQAVGAVIGGLAFGSLADRAARSMLPTVVMLLLARGAICDAPTQRGVTPLAGAAAGGHDGALLALLRAGASHGPDA